MPYINAQGQVSPPVTNTIPFYRAAYQGKNLHFWTPDADEFYETNGKRLPGGYFGEGIACYIFPAGGAQFSSAVADESPAVIEREGVVAPGQVLRVYGERLGGRVWVNNVLAEVVSASDRELRIVVPRDLGGASEAALEVERDGQLSKPVKVGVVPSNPALFGTNPYGRGHAEAVNEEGTANGPDHPAARGSVVTLYATGLGELDLPVEVRIGGRPAEVLATRVSGTRPGVSEVQVRVPESVEPAAFQPVVLQIGHLFTQPGIGLAIR
jgi:uncharacterized protein (TIGR03437 family)